jgi:hypothetical protein
MAEMGSGTAKRSNRRKLQLFINPPTKAGSLLSAQNKPENEAHLHVRFPQQSSD